MKAYVEVSRTCRALDRTECDVCKALISEPEQRRTEEEVVLSHVEREWSYGEVLNARRLEIDMCSQCFALHILPVLSKLGVSTAYTEG